MLSDFKDKALITGFGRFCSVCKTKSYSSEYISVSGGRRTRRELEASKSDINKLLSFTGDPLKYSRGTSRAQEKVNYLESIKQKFSEGQLASYNTARKKYNEVVIDHAKPVETKVNYYSVLEAGINKSRSIKIRYKGIWRIVDPYSLNKTYVVANCHLAHDLRTFRLDRIQGAELLEDFAFDKPKQNLANSMIMEAPNWKGRGGYRRRF
ncbi:MAG: WYL domain-containing protein [Candidatus Buchananbacteria bacterium]|nr:WYL domain-containing protein [Candidatus Buchananbacteria bacterium]